MINNVYPCKPQFYPIKVGFKGVKITKVCFVMFAKNDKLDNRLHLENMPIYC